MASSEDTIFELDRRAPTSRGGAEEGDVRPRRPLIHRPRASNRGGRQVANIVTDEFRLWYLDLTQTDASAVARVVGLLEVRVRARINSTLI
jgi:hypothetical protein